MFIFISLQKGQIMDSRIHILKGIHPGKLIGRDLKKQGITQRTLAERAGIAYQTINAIIAGRRNLTTEQALKIGPILGYEEAFLLIIQSYHDIKQYRERELELHYPHAPHIRRILFWDTDFDKINWGKHKHAVIKRVLERGNHEEIDEIKRFYKLSDGEFRQYKQNASE